MKREDGSQGGASAPRAPTATNDGAVPASLERRVRRGAVWSGAGAIVPRFINIAIMAVAARILRPQDFGVFAVAITVHMVIFSIAALGVGAVLMRWDVDVDEVAPTVTAIAIVSAAMFSVLMVILASPLAGALGSPAAAAPIRVLAVTVMLSGFFAVPSALLARDFRQDKVFISTLSGMVPANLLLIVLASHGNGAMSFAWSRVLEILVAGSMTVLLARRFYWPRVNRGVARRVLSFGLPLAGANLLGYTLLNADFAVIGHSLGPADLGLYMLAFNIASWPGALMAAMINGVAMPAFSRMRGSIVDRDRAVFESTQAVALIAFPICALTFALSAPLIEAVYGQQWSASAPVLSMLALYGAVSVVCLLLSNLIVGDGHPKLLFLLQLIWLAVLAPAMLIGVERNGIVGAGAAHVVVILFVVLPVYMFTLKRWRIGSPTALLAAVAGPVAGAIVAGGAAAVVSQPLTASYTKLILGGMTGLVTYLVAMSPLLARRVEGRFAAASSLGRVAGVYAALGRTSARGWRTLRERLTARPWADRLRQVRKHPRSAEGAGDVASEVRS